MKFIHLSDLHLGKRVNEYSMLEDQEYILKKIIALWMPAVFICHRFIMERLYLSLCRTNTVRWMFICCRLLNQLMSAGFVI